MEILECIKSRRSIRNYLSKPIDKVKIDKIIEAAVWTPSGKNGQPWKFRVITDIKTIEQISEMSIYGKWMRGAPCFICVFLDKEISYDYIKDVQSCGAVMQNMMLAAHSFEIGSCWIGEILPNEREVKEILNIDKDNLELMGIVVFGYKTDRAINPGRKNIESFLL